MIVKCEQCERTWEINENWTAQDLKDFARGHALNHRHTVTIIMPTKEAFDAETRTEKHD